MQNDLLTWYDAHARILPWRLPSPDPYAVWVSEIMLQQTTVKTVIPYFERFIKRFPTVEALATTSLDDIFHVWQGLGYYSRAQNLHQCAKRIAAQGFPQSASELIKLPGIGPYTASAIAAIAFNEATLPVDGNIIRVLARLNAFRTPLPQLKKEVEEIAPTYAVPSRPGDFAQALMDLGAQICTPRNPLCNQCPIQRHCKAFHDGITTEIPYKALKKPKPTRYGQAFISIHNSQILLRKRSPKGLLANMLEVPTTEWGFEKQELHKNSLGVVKHTFTHFHLYLEVIEKVLIAEESGFWVPLNQLHQLALSTLMKKILRLIKK